VLGIGDRHLDNFLIDQRTGQIIPIDFGASFGHATSILPVPEFLPFRLTAQFTALLRPLDTLGLLQHHAALAMAAFRKEVPDNKTKKNIKKEERERRTCRKRWSESGRGGVCQASDGQTWDFGRDFAVPSIYPHTQASKDRQHPLPPHHHYSNKQTKTLSNTLTQIHSYLHTAIDTPYFCCSGICQVGDAGADHGRVLDRSDHGLGRELHE
jgi:hypothetical protein